VEIHLLPPTIAGGRQCLLGYANRSRNGDEKYGDKKYGKKYGDRDVHQFLIDGPAQKNGVRLVCPQVSMSPSFQVFCPQVFDW
jgi:hypothetical protein